MYASKILDKLKNQRREARDRATSRGFLASAFQRRAAYRHHPGDPGLDPTRFGDWEYNGRCTDFS